jgi:uncharacterized protein
VVSVKKMKKLFVFVLLLVLLSSPVHAVIEEGSLKVFAVTEGGDRAMSANLILEIEPGTGRVWSHVEPLIGTATQTTEKLSVQVARNYSDKIDRHDYKFSIDSEASIVDGPSAGAAMGLLVISMMTDRQLPENVAITGTITKDGGVGAVGGVFKKSEEAAKIGIELFMIPVGEGKQIVNIGGSIQSINLIDYAQENWGMKIVEVGNIDDVLTYAFSDIEAIVVDVGEPEPEFVPAGISVAEHLQPMKTLTGKYIQSAELSIEEARTSLETTLLNEPGLIDAMLSSLNNSEKTLQKSRLLFEQNYLYSAANYSFLAIVDSSLVKDLSSNPSLLEPNSTLFSVRLLELEKDISGLKKKLNAFTPIDYLEWHIAAKERLSWAEEKVNKLTEEKTIVVTIGGEEAVVTAVEDLRDYEFAVAWLEAANDFYELTANSEKMVRPQDFFAESIDTLIINAENGLATLSGDETGDAKRRVDAAKLEKANNWYAAAGFDAATALAIVNADNFVQNGDLDELHSTLLEKIEKIETRISESEYSPVWVQLYLDHAKYYNEGAVFYREEGQIIKATEMVKSGLHLAFLSESLLDISFSAYDYYYRIPSTSYISIQNNTFEGGFSSLDEYFYSVLVVLTLLLLILLVVLFGVLQRLKREQRKSLSYQIHFIERALVRLKRQFEKHRISKVQYEHLRSQYQRQLNYLRVEEGAISHSLIEIDKLRCILYGFEHALRDLEKLRRKGKITEKDYGASKSHYVKQIKKIEQQVELEKEKLKEEKQEAEKTDVVSKIKKQEKKQAPPKSKPKKPAKKPSTRTNSKKQESKS